MYELRDGTLIEDETLAALMGRLMDIRPHSSEEYTRDHLGMAALFNHMYEDEVMFCDETGYWYVWDKCWRKQNGTIGVYDRLQTILNLLVLYCKEVMLELNDIQAGKEAHDAIESYSKFITSMRNAHNMNGILESAKPMMRVSVSELDKNPYLLTTPNHAYDLKSGKMVSDITPFNVTRMTTCPVPDFATKRCDRWYEYIDEIMSHNKEKAAFLQRALGYSLLGVNREECMFIAYGAKTRNGKGTLFSTINTVLGQDYASSAPVDLICESKKGKMTDFNAPQPALVKLVGTRFVTMSESAKDVRLDAASMKTMTGRDELVTRALYKDSFSFVPQFTLWLNTNHLPAVTDDTVFSSNRIWVIEFNEHFTNETQNKDLKDIFTQPENRRTVLKWLMDGCEDYMQNGLNPPACVIEATETYKRMQDRTGSFIEDMCRVGQDEKVLRGDLYTAYRTWCNRAENKYKPLGSTTFYNEMAIRGYYPKRSAEGWYIMGLSLTNEASTEGRIALL